MFSHIKEFFTRPSGYNIQRSVRLRSSASAYLNRTPASAGNRKTWTWSGWIKRGALSTNSVLFSAGLISGTYYYSRIYFDSNNALVFISYPDTPSIQATTSAVYRDPSSWYHVVCAVDTTQATNSNGVRIWVNGVAQTLTFANYTQNADTMFNTTSYTDWIGKFVTGGATDYFDGYLTEINFIDGQALTPSSFGSTNATTGVWQPKNYTGTYGTNGFYLNFSNNASTTTLGYDTSGNSNNWTTNNISLTAGSTYDSMTDVPTLTSATVANYCVLNPLQIANPVVAYSISNGNLQLNSNSGSTYNCFANGTIFPTTGKWYAEFTQTSGTRLFAGISRFTDISTPNNWNASSTYYINTGEIQKDGSTVTTGATWTTNDVIGVAYDADAATCAFYKNNTLQGTVTGVTAGTYSFSVNGYQSGVIVANFGQRPFSYTPPSGYVALNTYNLPASTIVKGNTVMDVSLWTGDGTSPKSQTNTAGFKPDLVWIKNRSNAYYNTLYDSVRGTSAKALYSNTTDAENGGASNYGGLYGYLSAFNSNGFQTTNGTDPSSPSIWVNTSGQTFVGWQWQAGQGSSSSNTNGSITSTVSVNATAGFSIVTYTGTGANATVGHGLGVAPKMIIVKRRNSTGSWDTYHVSVGNTKALFLNQTAAENTDIGYWNNTSPTSSVFTVGTGTEVNQSTGTYVAYCWSEVSGFSKAFSFTGNGSTDGSFVYCGFLPRMILLKRTDTTGNWYIWDTARNTYNVLGEELYPNLSNVASSATDLDVLSNGFKLRNSTAGFNASGGTYIGFAWATTSFKNSLGF